MRKPVSVNMWGEGRACRPLDRSIIGQYQLLDYVGALEEDVAGRLQEEVADYFLAFSSEGEEQRAVERKSSTFVDKEALLWIAPRLKDFLRSEELADSAVDIGFALLKLVAEQRSISESSSVAVTNNVLIDISSCCVGHDAERGEFRHAYNVYIENQGDEEIKVVGRQWVFVSDKTGTVNEVPHGSHGIVGYTPKIAPGDAFLYGSGTSMDSASGSMHGSLQIVTNSAIFDAEVSSIDLVCDCESRSDSI